MSDVVHLGENELARIVVDAAYKVHTKLGPGLLESVMKSCSRMNCENNN